MTSTPSATACWTLIPAEEVEHPGAEFPDCGVAFVVGDVPVHRYQLPEFLTLGIRQGFPSTAFRHLPFAIRHSLFRLSDFGGGAAMG